MSVCRATAIEGGFGETYSTMRAAWELEEEKDLSEEEKEVLQMIVCVLLIVLVLILIQVADETRHAVLAWQTLQWCVAKGSFSLKEPLVEEVTALLQEEILLLLSDPEEESGCEKADELAQLFSSLLNSLDGICPSKIATSEKIGPIGDELLRQLSV